jgi:BASS family bile acid:Na+ symporter
METTNIHFSPQSLTILNIILGFVLFGIALELKKEDFISLIKNRKSSVVGLAAHFIILPLLTFGLVKLLQPPPAIGLGMILVGACPGGNMSNMFTHIAKGNTALAVGLTSVSHLLAIVLTPLNFSFYGSLDAGTAGILKEIHLGIGEVLQTVLAVIGIPLVAGMVLRYYKPLLADKLTPYMKKFALTAFAFFLIAAFISNRGIFFANLTTVFPIVVLHNMLALSAGYLFAKLVKLPAADARTITFETGVQNSGLGLILIFTFFNGMAGMAIVAALWGIWHLVSGGGLALWWSRQSKAS